MHKTKLDNVSPDIIVRNPDNPRLVFRQEDLDVLLNSIGTVGIRVPLSVYQERNGNKYVLLDGERRWRCAKKLNLKFVPVVIEPEPSRLENILRMFNIHNVRVQWDLLAIAFKISEVQNLLKKEGKPHDIKDLAAVTGVSQTTVKRAFEVLELPKKYLDLLEDELKKPKSEQKYSEDFFIEMMKAMKAIEKHLPEVAKDHSREKMMTAFVNKYKDDVITNIVRFRDISKISRAEKAGVKKETAIPIVIRLIEDPKYTIEQAYQDSVARAYEKRTLLKDVESLIKKLEQVKNIRMVEPAVVEALNKLKEHLDKLLEK